MEFGASPVAIGLYGSTQDGYGVIARASGIPRSEWLLPRVRRLSTTTHRPPAHVCQQAVHTPVSPVTDQRSISP